MRVRRLRKYRFPRTGELVTFETKQYYVTDNGMVYDGNRHRYVKQRENLGYMTLHLRDDNGKEQILGVHRLVASTFLRLLQNGEDCHHISHDRHDNRLENIQIIDRGEHSRQHNYEKWSDGKIKTRNVGNDYRPAKQVVQLSLDGRLVKVWPSIRECGRNCFNIGAVSDCCRSCFHSQGNNTYKGFKWQYLSDYLAQQPTVSTAPVQIEPIN